MNIMVRLMVFQIRGLFLLACLSFFGFLVCEEDYQGLYLGKFNTYAHQVTGEVYAVDEYTLLIKNFVYDGLGQDTFFWAGSTVRPSNVGLIVPNEEGKTNKLQRYVNEDITIQLPDKKKITSIKWLAVWDIREHVSYADIYIPEGFEPPSPQRISEFSRDGHGVQSDAVYIIDSKTIKIPNLYYDGNSSDTYFWVGVGPQPNPNGDKIPDEKGYPVETSRFIKPKDTMVALKNRFSADKDHIVYYSGETVLLELPGEMTVFKLDWISIWNLESKESYGSLLIPDGLNIPPSLLRIIEHKSPLPNCEQLHKDLQMSWDIFGPQVTFELSGQIDDDEYMALGISGSENSSQMLGGDTAISYIDGTLGITKDYNITAKHSCINVVGLKKGVCPDTEVGGVDNYQIHTHVREDGITTITYRRNLINTGDEGDKVYSKGRDLFLIWAIGKYNKYKDPGFHHIFPRGNVKINLGRPEAKNCFHFTRPVNKMKPTTWGPLRVKERNLDTFVVRLGPSGGQKGYMGYTGMASPGIVFYINGLMAPELYLKRNKKYIFKIETGNDPHKAEVYHPLYITNDVNGGYLKYSGDEKKQIKIYAGVEFDRRGRSHPKAVGRLCLWQYDTSSLRKADNFPSFPKFRKSLKLECEDGDLAILEWTPNITTPDVVYYQSYTDRNMGWKIHVVDEITNAGTWLLFPGFIVQLDCIMLLYYYFCSS
ncbi:protein Skeletor, isoforms B/C-like [Limulus polyphemus]|uniref:Protein Skeletor, isoforms B/C-like n=1 Tax=Limulus polyphemus TaxID=6850 RepID=A0ABM1SLX9_LIMPO|nr:protein Skeletor, isoforms B/C-like [Limulus polyphemus]